MTFLGLNYCWEEAITEIAGRGDRLDLTSAGEAWSGDLGIIEMTRVWVFSKAGETRR